LKKILIKNWEINKVWYKTLFISQFLIKIKRQINLIILLTKFIWFIQLKWTVMVVVLSSNKKYDRRMEKRKSCSESDDDPLITTKYLL
jgi:hypothetical protein